MVKLESVKLKMSDHNSKRWHFELDDTDGADGTEKGIKVIHGGKEMESQRIPCRSCS